MEHFFGWAAMLLAITMSIIGLPSQILKSHEDKRVGLSSWMALIVFGVYTCRAIYGFLIGSYYIMLPDLLGSIFSTVLLFQAKVRPELKTVAWLLAQKRRWTWRI